MCLLSQHQPWFLPNQEKTAPRWVSKRLIHHIPFGLILLSSCAPTHILSSFSLFCLTHSILFLLPFLKVGLLFLLLVCSVERRKLEEHRAAAGWLLSFWQPRLEVKVQSQGLDPCQRYISLGKSQKCVRVSVVFAGFYSLLIHPPHCWLLFLRPSLLTRVFSRLH